VAGRVVNDDRAWRRRALAPIALWLCVIAVLTVGKVSGSSIAIYGEHNRPSAGQPRQIRGDEFLQRTPLVLRVVRDGFPDRTELGVGVHDTGVLADLPTGNWTMVLRPQAIAYHLLDVERAFALEWWLVLSAPFLGLYGLLVLLTRKVLLSVAAGLAVAVAPAALWWAIPSMGMAVGFAAACAAFLVAAGRAGTRRSAAAFALGAGWSGAGLVTVLYLPWTLPLALVCVPIGLLAWRDARRVRRADGADVAPIGWALGPAVAAAGLLTLGFLVQHRTAISGIQSTIYPGDRRSSSGGLDLRLLLSSPFDTFAGERSLSTVDGINQSEAAAGFAFWLPLLLAHGTLWSWRRSTDLVARCAWWAMTACTVMLAWAVLPIPGFVGRLTLLDRVPPERLLLPLTVGATVTAALYAAARSHVDIADASDTAETSRAPVSRAVWLTVAATAWAGLTLQIDGHRVSRGWVTLLCVIVGFVAWALLRGRGTVALAAVVVLSSFSTLRINPVQVGLQPILGSPLMRQIRSVPPPTAGTRWVMSGKDPDGYGILTASGVPLLSGLSLYPDATAWHRLDPTGGLARTWNRYGRVNVYVQPGDDPVVMGAPYPDVIEVSLGACSSTFRELAIGMVVSDAPITSTCLRQVGPPPTTGDELWFYAPVAGA
jgi:hypothetical protein